jgi:heme A synthase
MHFAFLQILLGALVAGIDAGSAFPTWPLMNGQFFPADAFYVPDGNGGTLPVWHAFFENPGLVQFMHRMSGYLLFVFGDRGLAAGAEVLLSGDEGGVPCGDGDAVWRRWCWAS